MELIVRAFPVLPGQEDQMRQFARDLQTTRAAEAAEFYGRMGTTTRAGTSNSSPMDSG